MQLFALFSRIKTPHELPHQIPLQGTQPQPNQKLKEQSQRQKLYPSKPMGLTGQKKNLRWAILQMEWPHYPSNPREPAISVSIPHQTTIPKRNTYQFQPQVHRLVLCP